jgi:hypothetical protein
MSFSFSRPVRQHGGRPRSRTQLLLEPLERRDLLATALTPLTNQLATTWAPANWVDVHVADVNGDGKADIVGRVQSTGDWWVAVNTGSGYVNEKWGSWSPNVTWVDVQVADVTGNGRADIIGRVQQTGEWWVALSTGTSFVNQKWTTWAPGVTWVDLHAADVTGDGRADLIGRVQQTGEWWVGVSTGSSFVNQKWTTWSPTATWVDVHVADVTGDGKADLVGRVLQTGDWWVGVSTGSGFVNQKWATWSPAATWVDVQVADVTGSGRADIIGRVQQTGQWWVGVSTGTGFLNELWGLWYAGVNWLDVQAADVNGDGRMDLIGRVQDSGEWWVALSTGTGFVNEKWGVWGSWVPWTDVQAADLIGNGQADVVGFNPSNGQWWTGLSSAPGKVLPLSFEVNEGQTDSQVQFLAHTGNSTVFLTPTEAVLAAPSQQAISAASSSTTAPATTTTTVTTPVQSGGGSTGDSGQSGGTATTSTEIALRMELAGANADPTAVPVDLQPNKTNYIVGNNPANWRVGVPNYGQVQYQNVYPGINETFQGNNGRLQRNFIVTPGASPGAIRMDFPDATDLEVNAAGQLIVTTKAAQYVLTAPVAYQPAVTGTHAVGVEYVLLGGTEVGFIVGPYDAARTLIIDPTLIFSTFVGGSGGEVVGAMAVSATTGNAYITGQTTSINFPTQGAIQTTLKGTADAFVTEVNSAGTALVYSTYLGGTGLDFGTGIALDASGNAFISGDTTSTDFPVTAGAFQTVNKGGQDVFVVELNPPGSAFVYSTYLGGSGTDTANGIAEQGGFVYVTGPTQSPDFPLTVGAVQVTFGNTSYVTELNKTGTALQFSTFVGGTTGENITNAIAVDASGVYVTGQTTNNVDFPVTNGAFQTTLAGGRDAFVLKLNATGSAYLYGTFIGGAADDIGKSIAVDASGNAYITGSTQSTNFPVTSGAFQTTFVNGAAAAVEAFVAKVNATGTGLVYSTYLGGTGAAAGGDIGNGITLNTQGLAYVVGSTNSTTFPLVNPFQSTNNGNQDAFVTVFDPAGATLVFSTFLGGTGQDDGKAIGLDGTTDIYVAGRTTSTDFPTSSNAFQTTNGSAAAFVTKFSAVSFSPPPPPPPPPSPPPPPPAPPPPPVVGPPNDAFETNDTSETATNFGVLVGSQVLTPLSINLHTVLTTPTYDQDWYRWTAGISGTFTATLSNIQANGGDIHERVFQLMPDNSLQQLGSSTLVGGVSTQTVSVPVQAGAQIFVWVYGYNFALGTYDMTGTLA